MVTGAMQSRSKELRLTIADAIAIVSDVNRLLLDSKDKVKQEASVKKQDEMVEADGGNF
jgi:hypothetical protein